MKHIKHDGKQQIGKSNADVRQFSQKILFCCKWAIKGFWNSWEMGNFAEGVFFVGGGNLKSDFDHLKFFQSLKQHSVHIDHQLKSKLAWLVSTKSIKLKWKWYGSYDLNLKWSFYYVLTWKLLCSGG